MSGFGSTPTTQSQGSLPTNQIPINSIAVPGEAGGDLIAMKGGPKTTDGNNNDMAPVAMYTYDGNDETQGAKADSAVTDSTTTNTGMSFLKGLVKILSSVWDSVHGRLIVDGSQVTQPVSGTVTANIGTTNGLALEAGHLATIDSHIPALGQALAVGSVPVVLTAAQQAALTPPAAITGFALEAGHLATIDTSTAEIALDTDNLAGMKTDLDTIVTNTTGIATTANQSTANTSLSSINTHVANIDSDSATLVTNTTGLATQATLASAKTDLDSIVTNTTGIATAANQTTGNTSLSTLAGIVSSNKAAVKAASGDFADGAIATLGTEADSAANNSTSSWSVIALLKGLFSLLAGVLATARSTVAVYSRASAASSGSTQNSGDLTTGPYTEIALDITTTAQSGTNPTIQFFYERKAADNNYYPLWQSAVLTTATNTLSTSIGAGMAYNQSLGATGRLRWVVGGTSTPTFTFSANIQGK